MANFKEAFKIVIELEGGYVNDPNDKGGATKFGISLNFLKNAGIDKSDLDNDGIIYEKVGDLNNDGVVDKEDIILLTKEYAEKLYKQYFWRDIEYITDQRLANQVFAMGVNSGYKMGIILLQRATKSLGCNIEIDGIFGPKTEAIVNGLEPIELNNKLVFIIERYYEGIVQKNPSQIKFLKGWKNRARKFYINEENRR